MRTPKARLAASEASTAPRRALGRDAAVRDQQHAPGPLRGAREVVDHRQHGDAAAAHPVERAEELELVADVEVGRRLVEQQHPRLLGEAARERRELALAGRQRAEAPLGERRDAGLLERASHRRVVRRVERLERPAVRVAAERAPAPRPLSVSGPSSSDVARASRRAGASRGQLPSGRPQSRTSPAAAASRPASARTSVDLPAAFGPTTTSASPA